MTGMRNRMSVARCCCECEDCCNGDYPPEYDVDITLANDVCSMCAGLSGTFTLAKVATTACDWLYDSGFTLNESCDPPYGAPVIRKYLLMRIRCISATQYYIQLFYSLTRQEVSPCPGYSQLDDYYWGKAVNVADYSCTAAADYHLPFVQKYDYRRVFVSGSGCVITRNTYLCDPSADAIITAIP